MKNDIKDKDAYKTIGETAKELNLIDKKTGKIQTYIIRYWESQFKQIKPSIRAGRRRYYSKGNIQLINYIKFLLKEKGLTINGVKKILKDTSLDSVDDSGKFGVYRPDNKSTKFIRDRVKNISKIIKELKKLKNG
jgi:DNA-binding transcriptional MerR regulator|tara:strand:- start:77 stop:481 length:405 start_codon:yes stop_codon:yes gene_type:complete